MPYEVIRFACGCEREVSLTGNSRQRRQRAEWLSRQICLVCQRKQEESVEDTGRQTRQMGPQLYGQLVGANGTVRLTLTVRNGYSVHDQLKRRGWRYDGGARVWSWQTTVTTIEDVRAAAADIVQLGVQPVDWLASMMAGDNAQAEAEWARATAAAQWITMIDAQTYVPLSVLQAAIADGRVRLSHAGPIRYVHRDDVRRLAEEVASGTRSDQ